MSTITAAAKYKTVLEAVRAGASVTQADLDAANDYAKRAKRARIKDATIAEAVAVEHKKARNSKNAGVTCSGNPGHKDESQHSCDRDAKANGLCMKHYIQVYRTDEANRRRANEASRRYVAKRRALQAAGK